MSASVHWAPLEPGHCLCAGCSSVVSTLKEAFGDLPFEIDMSDLDVLKGIIAGATGDHKKAYQELFDGIMEYGTVRVWANY